MLLFSFKFLKDVNGFEPIKENSGKITVTIPAGSLRASFRLDPHRCPDSTTSDTKLGDYGSVTPVDYTITVSIVDPNTYSIGGTSKDLEIQFLESGNAGNTVKLNLVDANGDSVLFKTAIENAFLKRYGAKVGVISRENRLQGDSTHGIIDKVSGRYGSEE